MTPDTTKQIAVSESEPLREGSDSYIIVFEDSDCPNETFSGYGAESAAWKRYEALSVNWNCTLFQSIVQNFKPDSISPPQAEQGEPKQITACSNSSCKFRRYSDEWNGDECPECRSETVRFIGDPPAVDLDKEVAKILGFDPGWSDQRVLKLLELFSRHNAEREAEVQKKITALESQLSAAEADVKTLLNWLPKKDREMFEKLKAERKPKLEPIVVAD